MLRGVESTYSEGKSSQVPTTVGVKAIARQLFTRFHFQLSIRVYTRGQMSVDGHTEQFPCSS